MNISEKPRLLDLIEATFSAYAKPFPEGDLLAAWWRELEQFPLFVVESALLAYRQAGAEFVPTPAAIARRCVLCDGRPANEEAWAIAITSRDESETVVWTEEMAEAFSICARCFPDEVAARMAFKDAYARLVNNARGLGRPAQWNASIGWDMRKREAILNKAASVGLLAAPAVVALLGSVVDAPVPDANARLQIQKIKAMMEQAHREKIQNAELHKKREAEAVEKRKEELAKQAQSKLNREDRSW